MLSPNVWSRNPVFLLHKNLCVLASRFDGRIFGKRVTPDNLEAFSRTPLDFFTTLQPGQTILVEITFGGRLFTAIRRFTDLHPLSTYYLAFLNGKDIAEPLITFEADPASKTELEHRNEAVTEATILYHQMLVHLVYLLGFEDAWRTDKLAERAAIRSSNRLPEEVKEALKAHTLFDYTGFPATKLRLSSLGELDTLSVAPTSEGGLSLWDAFEFVNRHRHDHNRRAVSSTPEFGYITLMPVPTYVAVHPSVEERVIKRIAIGTGYHTASNAGQLFPKHLDDQLLDGLTLAYFPQTGDPTHKRPRLSDARAIAEIGKYTYMSLGCLLVEPLGSVLLTAQFAIRSLPVDWWALIRRCVLDTEELSGEEEVFEDAMESAEATVTTFNDAGKMKNFLAVVKTLFHDLERLRIHSIDLAQTITAFRIVEIRLDEGGTESRQGVQTRSMTRASAAAIAADIQ